MYVDLRAQVAYHLERIRAFVPSGEDVKIYLERTLDGQIAAVTPARSMGVVPASMLSATQVYASARMAVEIVEEPELLAAKPEGIVDLGIIEWLLRPALLLRDGRFEPVASGPWRNIARDIIESAARAVCRLDLSMNGNSSFHIGTGFVAGKDTQGRLIIMTNAHVVDEAVRFGWPNLPGVTLVCDFARYTGSVDRQLFPLAVEHRMHPLFDLAILFVAQDRLEGIERPPVQLTVSGTAPDPAVGGLIGVIGHPSFDSRRDPFPKYFGFGDEFGVKRFSPGYIRGMARRPWRGHDVDVFLHDATTLSGSSGSCILDLGSMNVVGLHFGGWPMPTQHLVRAGELDIAAQLFLDNGAVPLWILRGDQLLNDVSFA